MSKINISVLMPVYNSKKYIRAAVDSIKKQTFTNWELILVDDGSTDGSSEICDELARADSRIRVIHKENTGVSDARNVLLENAKGEYISFVDSDDTVNEKMLELLFNSICKNNSEMSLCGFKEEHIINEKVVKTVSKSYCPKSIVSMDEMKDKFMTFGNSETLNPLWNKLYKNQIIKENNISFPKAVETGEDFIFNLEYLRNINNISFCEEPLYHYRKRNNESITYKYIDDMYGKGLEIHEKLESFLKDMNYYNEENKYILYGNHLMGVFSAILNLYHKDCPLNFNKKRKYIKDIINRAYVRECAIKRKGDKGLIGITSLVVRVKSTLVIMILFKGISIIRKVK